MSVIYSSVSQPQTVQSMVSLDGQQTQSCVVCGDPSDGPHFGAIACRACAAFFRRTVALKLEYVCRNNSDCQIDKSARNMCRSCRYQKCLRQGMLVTAVQQPRDAIGKSTASPKNRKEKHTLKRPSDTPQPSNSNGHSSHFTHNLDPTPHIVSTFSHMEICTSNPAACTDSTEPRYLCKMIEGYHHFLAVRRATQSLNETQNIFKTFRTTGNMQVTNLDEAKKYCKIESHILTDIINDYFPPFSELPVDDKIIAFKNFYSYFSTTSRAFNTYETFGRNVDNDDRILVHEGGYVKLSELEAFYTNTVNCKADPMEAARIFLPTNQYMLNVIVAHMRRIKITEAEYITLLGMFLWNDSLAFTSSQTIEVAWSAREIITGNLYKYYEALGITGREASQKVSNLLLLLPKLQKSVMDSNENFAMAEIFNVFQADECCKMFRVQ